MDFFNENYTVVWIDENYTKPDTYFDRSSNLTSIITNLQIFDNLPDFINFIESIPNDIMVFLIISGFLGENHMLKIHNFSKIYRIYVYCANHQRHMLWVNQYKKIRDIYTVRELLLKQLMSDVTLYSKSLSIPITIFKYDELMKKESSIRDLSKESALFIWYQLLFEIMLGSEPLENARKEMLNEFKKAYQNNAIELKKISEFEVNYGSKMAVNWYTRDCFLFRLVNRSMRTQNILEIYKYRCFIHDLHKQLEELHSIQVSDPEFSKVYRGQLINFEELERMRANIHGLISLNTYFSTSTDREVAYQFSGEGYGRPYLESIIFMIHIKPNVKTKPFANIQKFSYMKDEGEVLFSAGTVFRIGGVQALNDGVWSIELELTNDVQDRFNEFMRYMRTEIPGRPTLFTMGNFLSEMGDLKKAEQYYELLLNDFEHTNNLGAVSIAIAMVHYHKADYSNAIRYCEIGLKELNSLRDIHPDLATGYNLRGMIHFQMGELDDAMHYLRRALKIHQETLPSDDIFIASDLNNIASVDLQAKRYDQAFKTFEQVLKIKLSILPKDHPSIARTYVNIAGVYTEQRNWTVALKYLDEALVIQQKILPSTHLDLSVSYIKKAEIFMEQKQFHIAIGFCQQALNIQLQNLPLNSRYLGKTYSILATSKDGIGNHEEAIYCCKKALQFEEECHSSWERICHLQNQIGQIYCKSNNYQLALKMFMNALDAIPSAPPHILLFSTCNNIATLYQNMGDYTMALDYYNRSLDCLKCTNISPSKTNLITVYQNIGLNYLATEQYDLALESFTLVFSLTNEASLLAKNFSNIGDTYFRKENYQEALENYKLAIDHYTAKDDFLANTHNNIGMTQFSLGDISNALASYNSAVAILTSIGCSNKNEQLANVYSNMANGYLTIGDFSEAKKYFQKQLEYESDDFARLHAEQILANI